MHTAANEVCIQVQDFDVASEYENLVGLDASVGAVVFFVGKVRQNELSSTGVIALELEHYPAMTEKVLQAIVEEAKARWQVKKIRIVHRVGKIALAEKIVFVGVSASHRAAAFSCAEFLMDFLKVKAPFWKKEHTATTHTWVAAKSTDNAAMHRWKK